MEANGNEAAFRRRTPVQLMALFWILLLGFAAWLIYRLVSGRGRIAPREWPEEILRERHARGEIDRESYERMRDDLRR